MFTLWPLRLDSRKSKRRDKISILPEVTVQFFLRREFRRTLQTSILLLFKVRIQMFVIYCLVNERLAAHCTQVWLVLQHVKQVLRYLISMNIFKISGQRSPNKLLKFLNETPGIVNPKVPEKASYLSMVLPFMQGTRPL